MTVMIIPAAGLSTRYGLSRPKFLLQHPNGKTMLSAGLSGLIGSQIERVFVVSLEQFFTELDVTSIAMELTETLGVPAEFILLEKPTTSMVDTIRLGIEAIGEDTSIVIKDVDNFVEPSTQEFFGKNFLTRASLYKFPKVNAANKSYVEIDANDYLINIVEKRVISAEFNSGLIGFEHASDFLHFSSLLSGSDEKYVSDVIRVMLQKEVQFKTIHANSYLDWGVLSDWLAYVNEFATIFVDIDGVLAENENPYGKNGADWARLRPIEDNIKVILEKSCKGFFSVVFTTTRSEKYRSVLQSQLKDLGFQEFQLIMGLPHAKRILINDFAVSNPYPSAIAINLHRNARNLSDYFPN